MNVENSGAGRVADTSAEEFARVCFPELYFVVVSGPVSWVHIVQARDIRFRAARRHGRRGVNAGPLRSDAERAGVFLEQRARATFAEQEKDSFREEYWSREGLGACSLTKRGVLFSSLNAKEVELVDCEARVLQLNRDAQQLFAKDARRRIEAGETLYPVLARALAVADMLVRDRRYKSDGERVLAPLRHEMALATGRVNSLIQRQARFEYFIGVLIGAVLTIVTLCLLGFFAFVEWDTEISTPGFIGATVSGTLGAVVSVTQRISTSRLTLDFTAPRVQKMFLGGIRALMGAVFAAIVHFALLGGMLTANATGNVEPTPATFAFFSLAGFAAGFSERLATDVLETAGVELYMPGQDPKGRPGLADAGGWSVDDARHLANGARPRSGHGPQRARR